VVWAQPFRGKGIEEKGQFRWELRKLGSKSEEIDLDFYEGELIHSAKVIRAPASWRHGA
jgi:hypothetical protein